ncbi:MAG: hypothetical protein KGL93_02615 [Gemmatimonadota bacterium]|nr:hypothetical protein [Gemmatimonadota bacterium]
MKIIIASLVVMGVIAGAVPGRARAQTPWSADLAWGGAKVTGGTYTDRHRREAAGRLGYRVATFAGADLVAGAAFENFRGFRPMYYVMAPCLPPGCVFTAPPPGVPNFAYASATLGVRRALGDVTLALDGGLGSVDVTGAGRRLGASGGVEMAFPLARPVWAVLRGEILSWTEAGNTLYAYPLTVGIRLAAPGRR